MYLSKNFFEVKKKKIILERSPMITLKCYQEFRIRRIHEVYLKIDKQKIVNMRKKACNGLSRKHYKPASRRVLHLSR